jgi:hypothetical protein
MDTSERDIDIVLDFVLMCMFEFVFWKTVVCAFAQSLNLECSIDVSMK